MKSANDTLTIHNIDVDCSDTQIEYFRKIDRELDEDGNHVSIENDIPYTFDHSKGFQTMYGGNIFGIRPGETRRLPRYIAEKYTKELIDHLAGKESSKTGNVNLINDVNYRTALLDKIIIEEDILIQDQPTEDNMEKPDIYGDSTVLKEEEIEVGDSLRGFEVTEQPTITAEDVKDAPLEEIKDGEVVRTRAQLMAECKQLGLPVQRTDTTRDLLNRIKAF
jgi:hypothetical protein